MLPILGGKYKHSLWEWMFKALVIINTWTHTGVALLLLVSTEMLVLAWSQLALKVSHTQVSPESCVTSAWDKFCEAESVTMFGLFCFQAALSCY